MKKVVQDLTSGGIDWQREKWKSGFGSKFIRQGEKNAVKYIRGKEHIAQQGIERGKGVLLLCGQLAVFLPEEEHIRVAAVGAAIELPPEYGVIGSFC